MIKVNLLGVQKRKVKGAKVAVSPNLMTIGLVLILFGTGGYGYMWYSELDSKVQDLTSRIAAAEQQKKELEAVIKQNAVYEGRRKTLENRIKVIENLRNNQVSPVVSLDMLSDAIDKTSYVWLSGLEQNNTVFSMTGIGTSVDAIADFVANLEKTGYFRNINLVNATDNAGNFSFSLTCEFVAPAAEQRPAGGASNQN